MIKIGIIQERKSPPDRRVVLSPLQCSEIQRHYPISFVIEPSKDRVFQDSEYKMHGITVKNSLDECKILLGVKEVPVNALIEGKTYFFFSHTIKKQSYNKKLLQEILKKNICLIDWETIRDSKNKRLIAFGKWAGIVGTYNTFYAFGKRTKLFDVPRAYTLDSQNSLKHILKNLQLPPLKIATTGNGRVASGVLEMLHAAEIKNVTPKDYFSKDFTEPVFTQLNILDYNKRIDKKRKNMKDFLKNPNQYQSNLIDYLLDSDIYISAHYWQHGYPLLITMEEAKKLKKLKVIGDISCDINEPLAPTIRISTIKDPIYGYDKEKGVETYYANDNAITIMAVDNLPCELPKDASIGFGQMFIKYIVPEILQLENSRILKNATITRNGKLTKGYKYLTDFVY